MFVVSVIFTMILNISLISLKVNTCDISIFYKCSSSFKHNQLLSDKLCCNKFILSFYGSTFTENMM